MVAGACLSACDKCNVDQFNDSLWLEIPVSLYPDSPTLSVGDTLWIEIDLDKNVNELSQNKTVRVDSFDFATEIQISRIDDSVEHYPITDQQLVEVLGTVDILPFSSGSVTYFARFDERAERYLFKVGIILPEPGIYSCPISTLSKTMVDFYDHPLLYKCDRRKRTDLRFEYVVNGGISLEERHYDIFLETGVDYLLEIVDEERYMAGGWYAFRVVE